MINALLLLPLCAGILSFFIRGDKTRRALLATAMIYFWGCYAVMALSRISGPHRPDSWYGFSLVLMVGALLLRYADRWLRPRADETQPQITTAAA